MYEEDNQETSSLSKSSQTIVNKSQPQQSNLKTNKFIFYGKIIVIFFVLVTFIDVKISSNKLKQIQNKNKDLLKQCEQIVSNLNTKIQKIKNNQTLIFDLKDIEEIKKIDLELTEIQKILYKDKNKRTQEDKNKIDYNLIKRISKLQEKIDKNKLWTQMMVGQKMQQLRQYRAETIKTNLKKSQLKYNLLQNALRLSTNNIKSPYVNTIESRQQKSQFQSYLKYMSRQYHLNSISLRFEIPLCVIIYLRNLAYNYSFMPLLNSINQQNYTNHKLFIIEDDSTDNTLQQLKIFIKRNMDLSKLRLIRNINKLTKIQLIYNSIKNNCKSDDVIMIIRGQDQLIGTQVFSLYSQMYANSSIKMAYSSGFIHHVDEGNITFALSRLYHKSQMDKIRQLPRHFGGLVSFKAELFMKIREKDLQDQNQKWIIGAEQEVIIIPILQMACENVKLLDYYVFMRNQNKKSKEQQQKDKIVRQLLKLKQVYKCIQND